jgi:hypothetical protein
MITLTRFKSTSDGTFGVMKVNGKKYYTVEQPWNNNEPFKSCVPSGEYTLSPHESGKYGDVLCMVNNDGVTHFKEANTKRYACLIHVANYAKDVEGCIGLGVGYNTNMVTSSRKAISEFYDMISPNESHSLIIEWGEK